MDTKQAQQILEAFDSVCAAAGTRTISSIINEYESQLKHPEIINAIKCEVAESMQSSIKQVQDAMDKVNVDEVAKILKGKVEDDTVIIDDE